MRQHIPRVIADSTCSVRQTITETRVSRLMNLDWPVKPDRSRESALMDGNPKVSNSDLAQSRAGQDNTRRHSARDRLAFAQGTFGNRTTDLVSGEKG
jgi:hypothetical protein